MLLIQRVQQSLEVFITAEKIHFSGIYHQRAHRVLADELHVHIMHFVQVSVRYLLFVGAVALVDVLLQALNGGVEEYQDVWLRQLRVDDVEQFLVEGKLIVFQVHFGEEQAFDEKVIADGILREHIPRSEHFFQLLITFRHKEKLQRKGVLIWLRIKFGEERVVSKPFQDQPGLQVIRELVGEGGLSRADIAFYGNKTI